MTGPDEIEKQRVRGQVACVLKSSTSALIALPDMQAARVHLDDAQRALASARGAEMADEIERLVSGATRIDALQDQCAGLEIDNAKLRDLLNADTVPGDSEK